MDKLDEVEDKNSQEIKTTASPSKPLDMPVASSPSRQIPLSDFSPLKTKNISASFFAPPPISIKSSSSLRTSPLKATPTPEFNGNIEKNEVVSSNANANEKDKIGTSEGVEVKKEDSESDLTLSEGEDEVPQKEEAKLKREELLNSETFTKSKEIPQKEDVKLKREELLNSETFNKSKEIPIKLQEGEEEEEEEEVEVDEKESKSSSNEAEKLSSNEAESSSNESESSSNESEGSSNASDISLIISLPSSEPNINTSSNKSVAKTNTKDYYSSEEVDIDEEEENSGSTDEFPIAIDDDDQEEEENQIPVMLFRSTQLSTAASSPDRKNELSPKRVRVDESEIAVNNTVNGVVDNVGVPVNIGTSDNVIYRIPSPKRQANSTSMPPLVVSDLKSDNNNNQDINTNNNNKSNTGYVYDERMLHHFDPVDPEHPEKPARITSIYKKLQEAKLLDQARRIPIQVKLAEFGPEVQAVHDPKYCRKVNQSSLIRNVEELYRFSGDFDSVYFNASTAISATVAAVATIELCKAIGRGEIENGFGIVRPPGHHAEPDQAMGFCIYNNVAIAASTLLRHGLAKRVLILDWDVHHGNGTQDIFAASGDVLYVSVHRHDGGRFYPHVPEAGHTFVGSGKTGGLGRSINVAWNGPGFGDADYLYAFSRLIMPVAREFDPDFVIVSAGFDAASGDPIGECEVTTFGYSMMLRELMTLAGGRVAVILEGGYNLEVISKCYEACVRTLLKQPAPPSPGPMIPSSKAITAVENTVLSQSPYWRCLFPKPMLSMTASAPSISIPLNQIIDRFWAEECEKRFKMSPIPGLFNKASPSPAFAQKYSNRVLASQGALFAPDVLVVFAHEAGPLYSPHFISSQCLQPSKIYQNFPFLPLLEHFINNQDLKSDNIKGKSKVEGIVKGDINNNTHNNNIHNTNAHNNIITHNHNNNNFTQNIEFLDINLPTRLWKVKQTSLGNEVESQEFNVLFEMIWDRLISQSGCRRVFFVAAGSPIYAIGHLMNTRDSIETQCRGAFFFSSTLFLPIVNSSPSRSLWYQKNCQVIVPNQQDLRTPIQNVAPSFGNCLSAGQGLLSDSAALVNEFKLDIINFILKRTS